MSERCAAMTDTPPDVARALAVAEACEDLGFELIFETMDLVESIAGSTREACFKRDHAECRLRLSHLRLCTIAMIQTLNEMNGKLGPAP
jgi:hypothetical protein